MSEFFAMGGYAAYVWSAYAITSAVLILNIWAARRARIRSLMHAARTIDEVRPRRRPTVRQVE